VESDLKSLRAHRDKIPVNVDTTKATGAIARLKTAMAGLRSGLGTGLQKVGAGFKGLAGGVSSFFSNLNVPLVGALGVGLTLLAHKAGEAVGGMVMLADTLENNKIAFTTLLGSAGKADKFLDQLKAFGDATPFEFPELVAASKKLLAFGFAGKDIIPLMTTLGDAASNTGADVEALAVIFGQMKAKGKLATEDILQLVEAGIPAWGILADKMGLTVAQVQDLATKGKLGAKEFKALQEGMDETFGGGMDKSAKTLSGMISTLSDTWAGIKTRLGQAILPFAKAITPGLQTALENFGKTVESQIPRLTEMLATAAHALVDLPGQLLRFGASFAEGLLLAVGGMQKSFGELLAGLGLALDGFGVALSNIPGMGDASDALIDSADQVVIAGGKLQIAGNATKEAGKAVGETIRGWATAYDAAAKKVHAGIDSAKASASLNLSTGAAEAKISGLKKKLADYKKQKPSATLDAKTDRARAKLTAAEKWLKQLNKYKANPQLLAKDLASGKVAIVNGKLKRMKGKTVPIHAEDKTGPGVRSASKNLNSVKDKHVDITVQYHTRGKPKGTTADTGPGASMVAPVVNLTAPPPPAIVLSVRDEALADLLDVRINGQALAASRVLRRRELVRL
jgi:tape measure domain-containing protein